MRLCQKKSIIIYMSIADGKIKCVPSWCGQLIPSFTTCVTCYVLTLVLHELFSELLLKRI